MRWDVREWDGELIFLGALALLVAGVLAMPVNPAPVPSPSLRPFGYATAFRTCLWCGRRLTTGQEFFCTLGCGSQYGTQYARRGYRLTRGELVPQEVGE